MSLKGDKSKAFESEASQPRDSGVSASTSDNARPPVYTEHDQPQNNLPPDLSSRLQGLNVSQPDKTYTPTGNQCVAHLKLLEAFWRLKDDVGKKEGLFDITPPTGNTAENPAALAQVCEKRWAIYVARAVDRFETWWTHCIPMTKGGRACGKLRLGQLETDKTIHLVATEGVPLVDFTRDRLPPLDVLMVWHTYLLNPRCFFEDCFRLGKMDFYATGLPWGAVDTFIDPVTFEYTPSLQARSNFESSTGRLWDNLDDPQFKSIQCPSCSRSVVVPWSRGSGFTSSSGSKFEAGDGYADQDFISICEECKFQLTHEALRVQKFRNDVNLLMTQDIPLPGTVLQVDGAPMKIRSVGSKFQPECIFPSKLVRAGLNRKLMDITDPGSRSHGDSPVTIDTIKKLFETAILDKNLVKQAKSTSTAWAHEKVAIRRMMSRYWFNSSPFALDLTGAVLRQGSFIDKMHNIDWLHSPALMATMRRCLVKYNRFFAIMASNPRQVAVPTLDVDLAWHTHLCAPVNYYTHSQLKTQKLIDHDDKIEESKLSDAFARTSRIYQDKFQEPYSECTCWYCEAIRETHTSSLSRLFHTSNFTASERLHATPDVTSDPLKSPHISAHNAVRDASSEAKAKVKAAQLDAAYHQACTRARKKGRPEPTRDEYFYYYAWGYPIYYPTYMPYCVDPAMGAAGAAGVYPCDYNSVDTSSGAQGSCAAGTCGGMTSYGGGSCANSAGGCGGGIGGGGCGGSGGCSGGCGGCGGG